MRFKTGSLKEDYKRVLKALEVVKHKAKEDWSPVDLIDELYQGRVGLLISTENDTDIAIYYVKSLPYSSDKQLWIYIAYSAFGNGFELYLDSFKELATDLGCSSIGWDSKRPGYLRSLRRLPGTAVQRIEYRIAL